MKCVLECAWRTVSLTRVDLLQGDVLLQQPTEFDLGAILAAGAVVGQDEVRVAVVEHSQLAQRVRHRLIGSVYLGKEVMSFNMFKRKCQQAAAANVSHIFSDEVLFVFQDPPGSDSYCAHLPS